MKQLPINTPKQRLKIYKRALERLTNPIEFESKYGYYHFQLCILIRNLSGRDVYDFMYEDTGIHFPEFGKWHNGHKPLKYFNEYFSNRNKWRIRVINDCIKQCKGGK